MIGCKYKPKRLCGNNAIVIEILGGVTAGIVGILLSLSASLLQGPEASIAVLSGIVLLLTGSAFTFNRLLWV